MQRDNYMEVLSDLLRASGARPATRTAFQFAAQIGSGGRASRETQDHCIRLTLQWLQDMFHAPLARDAWSGQGFQADEPGRSAECITVPEIGLWTLRYELSDTSAVGEAPSEPAAVRTTDISFARRENGVAFGLRVMGAGPIDPDRGMRAIRPRLFADIAHQLDLRDCRRILDTPWEIGGEPDLNALYSLLIDPGRTLPVVVLTQPDKRKFSVPVSDYVLDPLLISDQLLGLAHVVQLPWELGYIWTEMVSKPWSVYLGSVRVYMPGLNFERDGLGAHPLYLTEKILFWQHEDMRAERAFTAFLTDKLASEAVMRRINWEDRLFVTDARTRAAELEREKLAREREAEPAGDPELRVTALEEELTRTGAAHAREVEALHRKIKELQEEAEEFNDDAIRAGRERDMLLEKNHLLREKVVTIRAELFRRVGYDIPPDLNMPDGYDDLPDWVSRYLSGKLILHPRALQGIKGAVYESVETVCETLLLLGSQYRAMKLGTGSREDFVGAVDRLQLRYGKSISEIRAGEQGSTYYVKYPVDSATTRFLEMHLRSGGNSRDPHRCLAVYFFWDEDSEQVVVGWLPSHLDNRLT